MYKWLIMLLPVAALGLGGCSDDDDGGSPISSTSSSSSSSQSAEVPEQYEFESRLVEGESAVSYTGQTKRHVFIANLVEEILSWSRDSSKTTGELTDALNFYYRYEAASSDSQNHDFTVAGGELVVPGPTYGDITDGKDLIGKTAGEDPPDLLPESFFGWTEDGIDADSTPVELVDKFFELLVAEARTDTLQITVSDNMGGTTTAEVIEPYIDEYGRDYRQLIQKYLLGAVAYSQGTGDYLQTDFQATNEPEEEGSPYTVGGHNWDEAFGYFGAARNYNDYTDDEIRASGGDTAFQNGYNDANGDGNIDIRSEYNFGNSVNCAKRDAGSANNTNPTDFTKTAFDAFLSGRHILAEAADGELTDEQADELREQVLIASKTWEKCVAATVVHYINDVITEMDNFDRPNDAFADLDNFKNLAKTWSEMKGFALGLQFNPDSPFRDGTVTDIDIEDLKEVLSLMGDAPVLADGTQHGDLVDIDDYSAGLLAARDILEAAYEFDSENVENW